MLCRYGVSGRDADGFERACEQHVYAEVIEKAIAAGELREEDASSKVHNLLLGKTTVFSPEILVNAGAPAWPLAFPPDQRLCAMPGSSCLSIGVPACHCHPIDCPESARFRQQAHSY